MKGKAYSGGMSYRSELGYTKGGCPDQSKCRWPPRHTAGGMPEDDTCSCELRHTAGGMPEEEICCELRHTEGGCLC